MAHGCGPWTMQRREDKERETTRGTEGETGDLEAERRACEREMMLAAIWCSATHSKTFGCFILECSTSPTSSLAPHGED